LSIKDNIATVTFNRPEALNSIPVSAYYELIDLFETLESDSEVRVAILTGAGRGFCSGGDISEMIGGHGGVSPLFDHMQLCTKTSLALVHFSKPLIAAVNGAATGAGFNIAISCDIAYASEKAKFSQIFGQVGLCVDFAGTYLLPRLVGRARAKELVFTKRIVTATEAKELGIVQEVYPADELYDAAKALAKQIAEGPAMSYAMAKQMINRSFETDVRTMLDFEGYAQTVCGTGADHEEGVKAFIEKRKPQF